MNLFDRLPSNLFSILVSKNKALYAEALFVLRKAFKQHMTISKSDLVAMLIASLDEALLDLDLEAEQLEFEETEEELKSGPGQSATAHLILRRLMATKWIEVEYLPDSFEEIITLPDYTIKILDLLYSLTDDSVREYNSYVYSTYSALRTADTERDDFMYNALLTAHENTLKLVDELKSLHNNIRRYHQALNDYLTVNDILKGHFDEYKELIMDRIYHPLKTMDSVPRYKIPIMKILSDWLSDSGIRQKMAEQAIQRGKYITADDAMEDILYRINEISDIYEDLDDMLAEIDRKRTAYTRASMEKMRYLLTTDRSIKGKLVGILSAAASDREKWSEILADNVNLFRQSYIDEKSPYVKPNRMGRKEGKPLALAAIDENIGDQAFKDFLKKAKKQYSHSKIMAFMTDLMKDKYVLNSNEIRLANDDEFVMLVLATLKKDENGVFYRVEFKDGHDTCDGYVIPRMRFIRREQANVD
ncbi:MAG: hypothetical protein GX082_09640 [Clostridiaceae bacterium]|nr:hypothetical protein [Clostridiaceae bacterium]